MEDGEGDFAGDGDSGATVEFAEDLAVAALCGGVGWSGMAEGKDVLEGEETGAAEETCLGTLFYDFCWDADGASCNFTEGGGKGMCEDDASSRLGLGAGGRE